MKIVINDANILIDIVKLELLEEFSNLNFELNTTDFVLEELNPDQNKVIQEFISSGKIQLITTNDLEDLQGINNLLESSSGLSFEDCSVWYYSKKMNCTLLTGDGKLRKTARKDGVEVRGIIYVFDQMLAQNKLAFEEAIEKIELLYTLNNRLPKKELTKRLELWKNKKYGG